MRTRHRERVRRFTELVEARTPEERAAISAALPALDRMAALLDTERWSMAAAVPEGLS
ncbi:hypothetical protein ACFWF7_01850 [Nocardia sp. NPDC060256]|uniref:hypothetical protein n=1 Tax=unclassified Nocardia TaxID=2637762 RepID=UPI003661D25B